MGSVVSNTYSSSRKKVYYYTTYTHSTDIYPPFTDTCNFYTYLSTDTDNTDNTPIGTIKNAVLCFWGRGIVSNFCQWLCQ